MTVLLAPEAMSPKSQVSWLPLIWQSVLSGSSTQLAATGPGRASLRVTDLAVPGPAFPTWIEKTTSSPALIVWAFGVFTTLRSGFSQLTLPSSSTGSPALDAEAVAVLS